MNTAEIIPLKSITTLDEHAARINGYWKAANRGRASYVENIVRIGNELIAAQEEQGESFRSMESKLPFDHTTAFRLIDIARNPVLRSAQQSDLLPASWYTLYDLAKLPPDILRAALKSGAVHPEMTRKDVRKLRPTKLPAPPSSGTPGKIIEIIKAKPCTTDEVRKALPDVHPQTVNSALHGLAKRGWAVDTGKRKKNRDDGGRPAIVYTFDPQPVKPKAAPKPAKPGIAQTKIDPEDCIKEYRALIAKAASAWPRDRRIREVDALVKALDLNIRDWVSYVSFGKRK